MDILAIIFFIILIIYIASLVTLKLKKKLGSRYKKVFLITNLTALMLSLVLIILWSFNRHLVNLTIEILPFWTFIVSAILVFGLTVTNRIEKIFYGIIYFGNLFLLIILLIPFLGMSITSIVYSPFLKPNILYQDKKIILTEESIGFLAPKPCPTIYIKCGFFSQKYKTNLFPIYSLDSVTLKRIDNNRIEIEIHGDKQNNTDRQNKQTLECDCL